MTITWTPQRVKTLRLITRNPQATFAPLAGVSRVTISNWESGLKAPSVRHQAKLDKIAEENGVTQRRLDK